MRAGKLRQQLTIQRPVESRSSSGAPVESWATFAEVRGAVEPLSGRMLFAAQEFHSEVTTRIRLRYLEGITASMRVVLGAHIFLILYPPIDWEFRHRELQLLCKEFF